MNKNNFMLKNELAFLPCRSAFFLLAKEIVFSVVVAPSSVGKEEVDIGIPFDKIKVVR